LANSLVFPQAEDSLSASSEVIDLIATQSSTYLQVG
jgi:hypothetical protein